MADKKIEKKIAGEKIIKIAVPCLLVVALIIYAVVDINFGDLFGKKAQGEYIFKEADFSIQYASHIQADFHVYGKGFYYVNKDGIKYITDSGDTKMHYMYSMTSPIMRVSNEIVAVSEQRSNRIYVFNINGLMYEKQLKNPLISFSVDPSGICSIITQNEDDYIISVFNKNGDIIHENVFPSNQVFAVMTSISNDGRILAVLYYDISGVEICSKITFYYLVKSEAIDYQNSIFGGNESYDGETIWDMRFMNDNKLITISDKSISCIDTDSKCQKIWNIKLNNKLDAIYVDPAGYIALAYGDGFLNTEPEPVGFVRIYNADLTATAEFQSRSRVTYLSGSAAQSAVIIGSGRHYDAIKTSGDVLWEYESLKDLKQTLFLGDAYKILTAGETRAEILHGERAQVESGIGELEYE